MNVFKNLFKAGDRVIRVTRWSTHPAKTYLAVNGYNHVYIVKKVINNRDGTGTRAMYLDLPPKAGDQTEFAADYFERAMPILNPNCNIL